MIPYNLSQIDYCFNVGRYLSIEARFQRFNLIDNYFYASLFLYQLYLSRSLFGWDLTRVEVTVLTFCSCGILLSMKRNIGPKSRRMP